MRKTIREIAWGLIAFVVAIGLYTAYEGLMEWRFALHAVRTDARIGHATVAPEWTVEFQWDGLLHTALTDRLSGSPIEGDRVVVLVDPDDTNRVTSPDMTLDDWSDLPEFIAVEVLFLTGSILVLRFVPAEGPAGKPMPYAANRADRRRAERVQRTRQARRIRQARRSGRG